MTPQTCHQVDTRHLRRKMLRIPIHRINFYVMLRCGYTSVAITDSSIWWFNDLTFPVISVCDKVAHQYGEPRRQILCWKNWVREKSLLKYKEKCPTREQSMPGPEEKDRTSASGLKRWSLEDLEAIRIRNSLMVPYMALCTWGWWPTVKKKAHRVHETDESWATCFDNCRGKQGSEIGLTEDSFEERNIGSHRGQNQFPRAFRRNQSWGYLGHSPVRLLSHICPPRILESKRV